MTQFTITVQYIDGSENMGIFVSSDPPLADAPQLEGYVRSFLGVLIQDRRSLLPRFLEKVLSRFGHKERKAMIDNLITEAKERQSRELK